MRRSAGLSSEIDMLRTRIQMQSGTVLTLSAELQRVKSGLAPGIPFGVEVDRLDQIDGVLAGGADIVMLDNFSLADLARAVAHIGDRARTEASGGVNLASLRAIAETGVETICVGALTHSAPALDLGLDIDLTPTP